MKFNLVIACLLMIGCCKYHSSDFKIATSYISIYNNYKLGDTIYFSTQENVVATVYIAAIDSFQICGGFMGVPRKDVTIEIQHLPNNIWTGGQEFFQNKPVKILNQNLVTVEKIIFHKSKVQYFIGINYRDFVGEVTDSTIVRYDDMFETLGVGEYWEIGTELPLEKLDSNAVTKVFWSEKYGLTGYYKRNGELYKINSTHSKAVQ